ncbi:MAG TPA: peptide ABC transporter substrate-binding protein [Opitutaceae bacterium]|nr:peptide ABC transporter substrate-binding protein [Opitutaceae bacterium]
MHPGKFQLLPALAIAAGLLAAAGAGCARREAAPSGQVLRISQRNEPGDLDPATASLPDEFFIIRAVGEGLVRPSSLGLIGAQEPGAAARWENSPDGLTYTFHLRPEARWSNGEPVVAADFVDSYRRVLTPATAAPKAPLFFAVRNARAFFEGRIGDFTAVGFRAADPLTLVITLERPMPRFLAYVASGPWIPVNPRVVARYGRQWTRPEHSVGNGPFTLAEWRPHQRIAVRKNPQYAEAGQVPLDEIDFIAFDNGDAEERAFRAGQLDVTMDVPRDKLATYAREHPAELQHAPLLETRYLSFNTRKPPLDDVRVRRALALALDRKKLVERVLLGGQEPAFRLVPSALYGNGRGNGPQLVRLSYDGENQDEVKKILNEEDPVEARRLLADAGFPEGRGFPRLELTCWSPSQVSTLEVVQEMWRKELGIEVTIATREVKVHQAALSEGRYDIALMTVIPDVADPFDIVQNFRSDSPANYPHWSDARYDSLLPAADGREYPSEAEYRLQELCPLTPLYFNAHNWLMSPRVRGWREDGLWTRFYNGVSLREK